MDDKNVMKKTLQYVSRKILAELSKYSISIKQSIIYIFATILIAIEKHYKKSAIEKNGDRDEAIIQIYILKIECFFALALLNTSNNGLNFFEKMKEIVEVSCWFY